jgi:CubicO group peptidase (beta-lactamase class C family)
VEALRLVEQWPVGAAAAGVVDTQRKLGTIGPRERTFRWASVTKLLTSLAVLVALEEGAVDLDEPAGPEDSTLRHLLAHASGLALDEKTPIARVGTRRIYSNTGIEKAAALVAEHASMPFAEYLADAVLEPLGLTGTLRGSPASGYAGPLDDLLALGRECLAPTLIAPETLDEATTVQFPGLAGVLPGWGRHEPNDWGLAFELRDDKSPHWTSRDNSPRTFGHFGQSGTFLWVDPGLGAACGVLTNRDFGAWAKTAWPAFNDSVVREQRA